MYKRNRSTIGIIGLNASKFIDLWAFYLGPLLTLPFVMVIGSLPMGFSWRSISLQTRFLLAAAFASIVGLCCEVFFYPHYAAPMTCLILALMLVAMRRLYIYKSNGQPVGRFLIRALPIGYVLLLALRATAGPLHIPLTPDWPLTWYNWGNHHTDRARILAQLERDPQEQLIIVRYAPHSGPLRFTLGEWVHNRADIDHAKVVWAQDMGAAANQQLICYYKSRQVWMVEPDKEPVKLEPYPAQAIK